MEFGTQRKQTLILFALVMQIGLEMQMTEKVQVGDVFIWETIWFLGTTKNKTQSHCLLLRPSTLLQAAAVRNYYG